MPRTSRGSGGSRQGQPGKAYPNRTDLNAVKLPAQAETGQQYGQAGAQLAAQHAVPMGASPGPAPPTPTDQPAQDAWTQPGSVGWAEPTARPDEHVMSGAPIGAGTNQPPGIMAQRPDPLTSAAGILNSIGPNAAPQVKRLRDIVNAQLANQGAP